MQCAADVSCRAIVRIVFATHEPPARTCRQQPQFTNPGLCLAGVRFARALSGGRFARRGCVSGQAGSRGNIEMHLTGKTRHRGDANDTHLAREICLAVHDLRHAAGAISPYCFLRRPPSVRVPAMTPSPRPHPWPDPSALLSGKEVGWRTHKYPRGRGQEQQRSLQSPYPVYLLTLGTSTTRFFSASRQRTSYHTY
ncbi:hypothetical protein BD311DRAFT_165266 [Dichomitus squalens]|uniref:Uncharacterized protein n=1 Tax=Dichomitus squalens TaxID=114155 RepID=A0A4V2JYR8_9APHY|nr:hypothetical protein BD311DRAFT_165266 [Dichomitus squalens]